MLRRVLLHLAALLMVAVLGLVWLIDHASRQNVDVRVVAAAEGLVEGEVSFLGVDLGAEMLRAGMAQLDPAPPGGAPLPALAAAEAQARVAVRGCWAPGAGLGR